MHSLAARRVAVIALVLLLGGIGVRATTTRPGAAPPVRFAGDWNYGPYSFLDDQRRPHGYDVDLFQAAARRAGIAYTIELDDWQRVQARLKAGQVDVVPMLVSPERATQLLFSQPYLVRYHLVFGKRDADFIGSIDALAGRRVAVQRQGRAWEELRRHPAIRLVLVDVEGDCLRAVAEGRADFAFVPKFVGLHARRAQRLDDVVAVSPPLLSSEYAFAMPLDRTDLKRRLDAGMQAAIRSGEADRLYVEWLGDLTPQGASYRSGMIIGLWLIVPLVTLAVFLLLRWRRARAHAVIAMQGRSEAEARARHLLHHDTVTGALNAAGLRVALSRLIDRGTAFALIRLDLLGLASMESITGHVFVDRLLLRVACRLTDESRCDLVASVGRGTFYLVRARPADVADARRAMDALLAMVSRGIEINGVPVEQNCCAGAALFPAHAGDAGALMRAASVAAADASQMGGTCVVYDRALDPDPRNLTLLADLRRAIAEGTLGFALQAKIDLATGELCGAEMLVRWVHPEYGALPPAEFVPLAEQTQVIGEMTLYLVDHAARLIREWAAAGIDAEIAVNVSASDLLDARVIEGILARTRDVAPRIVLEITETGLMRDARCGLAAAATLREGGIRLSLDDFGTGNASLTFLRQLRPDEVKVDRSFIAAVTHSAADEAIVRSTIQLAHSLGAKVTAEGVEDRLTLDWLRHAGADAAQGFCIARPEPAADFSARLHAARSAHAPMCIPET